MLSVYTMMVINPNESLLGVIKVLFARFLQIYLTFNGNAFKIYFYFSDVGYGCIWLQ
jgi:hypothetical protein